MEHVYNGKENTKYLKLLKQNYSSSQAVIREIVNLTAITNLPKGTEFFLSDIHGEYEAFLHIMNNCSGVIKEKVDLIFKDTLSEFDRQELCTLIYYPREKMTLLGETNRIDGNWYAMTLNHLIMVAKLLSSKYTRSKVRRATAGRTMLILLTSSCMRRKMKMQTRFGIISRYYRRLLSWRMQMNLLSHCRS